MNKSYQIITGVATLILQVFIFRFLFSKPEWIEYVYIPRVFAPLSQIMRAVSSVFPFSIGLIMLYLLGLWPVYVLIKNIRKGFLRKRTLPEWILRFLAILSPVYLFYMLTWGLLYHRIPIAEKMNYSVDEPVRQAELEELCDILVTEINDIRKGLKWDDFNMKDLVYQSIEGLNQIGENYHTPSVKMATGSHVLALLGGASGIYTFWTGEANINKINPIHKQPAIALHEMAHQLGYASEDEASYIAWLAGKDHPDPLFRYSARSATLGRALGQLWMVDSTAAHSFYNRLDSLIYEDSDLVEQAWAPYPDLIWKYISEPFYIFFLNANGEEDGYMAYDRVIDLMIYERRGR